MPEDPDDTVRIAGAAPVRPGHARRRVLIATGAVVLLATLAGAAFFWRLEPPAPAPVTFPLLAEDDVLAMRVDAPTMVRWRGNPRVFIVLLPSPEAQAQAMNRLAALVEKAGLPRDRLLADAELAEAVRASGDTAATWYLAHDYAGADLARFFALADRDGTVLTAAERWLRARLAEARGLVAPAEEIALISVPMPDARLPEELRSAMLRHEIGHGEFFTRPEIARIVLATWTEGFTERDRAAFRQFLGREGYDTTNERLMANEAMAYLVWTPDPRLFSARHLGLAEPEVERLRTLMREAATRR